MQSVEQRYMPCRLARRRNELLKLMMLVILMVPRMRTMMMMMMKLLAVVSVRVKSRQSCRRLVQLARGLPASGLQAKSSIPRVS